MNVLEKILEEIDYHAIEFESFGMCDEYVSVGWIKEIIRSHMGEVENNDWIPVSERPPEENDYYLITVKELNYGEHVTMSFFNKYDMRGWQHVHMANKKVTAWQPLPGPYKGE